MEEVTYVKLHVTTIAAAATTAVAAAEEDTATAVIPGIIMVSGRGREFDAPSAVGAVAPTSRRYNIIPVAVSA